jgi:hypothetical protein
MEVTEKLQFDNKDCRDIYECVESHGASRPETIKQTLDMCERAFGHHVTILKRDGVIRESEGKLRVAFDLGSQEE